MSSLPTRSLPCGAALVLALAAGCVEEGQSPVAAAEPPAEAAAELEQESRSTIAWQPCAEDPELQCGWLSVPAEYREPHGPRLRLATVRAPATGADRRGSLFVNPGGPGGSGVDLLIFAKPLFDALRQHFDIVSFDPRGTNRSQEVTCEVALPPQPSSGSPAELEAYHDEISRRVPAACAQQHGALATRIGTAYTARDIDSMRAALGERTISYLGYSYGTALGSAYATLFPERVRAMVLDGNVPPSWFSDNLLEIDSEGSAEAELALRRLDQLCRADVQCPLRGRGVVATFDRLVARLDRAPVPVEGGVIDGMSIRGTVFGALYAESLWPRIVTELVRAEAGLYDVFIPSPSAPAPTLTLPSAIPVICSDSRTRRWAADYLAMQELTHAVSSRFGGVNFGDGLTTCAAWPVPPSLTVSAARTKHPIVLIGNDYDPATPMTWTRAMGAALQRQSRIVRYRGGGHTIYGSGSACIDGAVEAYLVDLIAPVSGLTCPAVPRPFGAVGARAATRTMAEILSQVAPLPRGPRGPALRARR